MSEYMIKYNIFDFAERCKKSDNIIHQKHKEMFGVESIRNSFHLINISDEHFVLFPDDFQINFYRGQNNYYDPCYSAIFRDNLSELLTFIERLRLCEFMLLIEKHPIVIFFNSYDFCGKKLLINKLGLAQHYGIKTELIDFTSDPLIAAFFAVTKYNEIKDKYEPIINSNIIGVFYVYNGDTFHSLEDHNKGKKYPDFRFNAIGLQPLPRPGNQLAYSYKLLNGDCLNKISFLQKNYFKHDWQSALKIYDLFEGGNILFPCDIMHIKTKQITKLSVFGEEAFYKAYREYKPKSFKK